MAPASALGPGEHGLSDWALVVRLRAGDEAAFADLVNRYHSPLRPLFEEAEDSSSQLDRYTDDGVVLVVRQGSELLGHVQLVATGQAGTQEIKNIAVMASRRGARIGTHLIDAAVAGCRTSGITRVVVATAAADVGNLRFYQRCGFRITAIEPDAFTPANGYPDPVVVDGIELRDRVWLARQL